MKPEYKVPSMSEIKAIPWNGYNVVSTFSGCGGSCLGYRMAGFRVLWANEFIPAARETYKANHPDSYLDSRDIRNIKPEDILDQLGMKQGDVDLLDGSPPCASFSTAGKRESGWGKEKKYSDSKQRTDDLFFEYARMLRGLQPKVFVAENVSGLVKGTAKGYFKIILKELKSCGYNVKAKVLDAQWLGVPQMRQRLIFVGIRNDLGFDPIHPLPLGYRYGVRDAVVDVLSNIQNGAFPKKYSPNKNPSPAIVAQRTVHSKNNASEKRRFTIDELKRICAFPDDFILTGTYSQQWERLGRAVPPVMMFHIADTIRREILDKI